MPKTNLFVPNQKLAEEKVIKWIKGNVSQKELSKLLQMPQSTISYKLNHKSIRLDELLLIFHAYADQDEIVRLMTYR